MTQILDGHAVSRLIRDNLKHECEKMILNGKRVPCLAVILVGDDPASQTYVASKKKQCEAVGMTSRVFEFSETISQETLLECIKDLNKDGDVDGILLQLPLPGHFNEEFVLEAIDPSKDVDGLHPLNVGLLEAGRPQFVPCTPKGIMTLLRYYDIELEGKRVLVIGRSQLVGKPIASLLLQANATVTIAHSKTMQLQTMIREFDIVVVAMGKPQFIKASMLEKHQVIIDVGIHRQNGGLCGDVEREAQQVVSSITPVPKGVGPMTIASLLENTLKAYTLKEHSQ